MSIDEIRQRLDELVARRFVDELSPSEKAEYCGLCAYERASLWGRH